ncbi:hypothetical protein Tco_1257412 [Tanacetum coccineum]
MEVLLRSPLLPKHTSSFILPSGFDTSPANPTRSVWVSLNPAFICGLRFSKQCLNITSTDDPSSTYTRLTKYPSTSASMNKGSSEISLDDIAEKDMGMFIYDSVASLTFRFLSLTEFTLITLIIFAAPFAAASLAECNHLCNGLSPGDSRNIGQCYLTLMDLTWDEGLEDAVAF